MALIEIGFAAFVILLTAGVGLIVYAIIHALWNKRRGKGGKLGVVSTGKPEQTVMTLQAEIKKKEKENERLSLAVAKNTEEKMQQDIIKTASKTLTSIVPKAFTMLDPHNQIRGRPIYYIGGMPVFQKYMELQKMLDSSRLGKLFPELMEKIYNWRHFGPYDTLFYWTADLMPDVGKWLIIATSKPPKCTGKSVKKRWGTKEYIIEPAAQDTIDSVITNKWEAIKGGAALILTATFKGPVPLEKYLMLQKTYGWSSNVKED